MKRYYLFALWWVCIPHILIYLISNNKQVINEDLQVWRLRHQKGLCRSLFFLEKSLGQSYCALLVYLLLTREEYRNLFYKRVGAKSILLRYLPQLSSLYINTPSECIGGGLYLEHGFSTIVNAKSIGKNCFINQQVTIGSNTSRTIGSGEPAIGDNVSILTGSIVIGNIEVGNNATVGAGSVVVRDVPENTLVVMSKAIYKEK